MTVIAQDDHLTAGAWAACDSSYDVMLMLILDKINLLVCRLNDNGFWQDLAFIKCGVQLWLDFGPSMMSVFQLMLPFVTKTLTHWFYHLYVTFVAAGHFVTFPYKCSAPITMFPAICWFWIGTFSKPYLYATDCFSADTPGTPLTPTTID